MLVVPLWQGPYIDVFEIDLARRIVALQGKGAAGEALQAAVLLFFDPFGFGVVNHGAVVDLNDDAPAFDPDRFGEPFAVFYIDFFYILHAVKAAGAAPVALRVVHLYLVAPGRPAILLVGRMEKDTGVGAGRGHDAGFELEVFEVVALHIAFVKEVRSGTVNDNGAILHTEGGRVLGSPPALQARAIKKGDPALPALTVAGGCAGEKKREDEKKEPIFHLPIYEASANNARQECRCCAQGLRQPVTRHHWWALVRPFCPFPVVLGTVLHLRKNVPAVRQHFQYNR